MDQIINSDESNPEMLASQTFDNILDSVKRSNLNFQLQVLPFSAYISLKKSLVKNKSGSFLLPPQPPATGSSLTHSSLRSDSATLIVRINELENALVNQRNKYEDAVIDREKIIDDNKKLHIENKALKQEKKSLETKVEKKALEVKQLKDNINELNKDKNTLNIALKSIKQDVKSQRKTFEKELASYEKKVSELSDFKTKKLNEERREKITRKKEQKREAQKNRNYGNNDEEENNDNPDMEEKKLEENVEQVSTTQETKIMGEPLLILILVTVLVRHNL